VEENTVKMCATNSRIIYGSKKPQTTVSGYLIPVKQRGEKKDKTCGTVRRKEREPMGGGKGSLPETRRSPRRRKGRTNQTEAKPEATPSKGEKKKPRQKKKFLKSR